MQRKVLLVDDEPGIIEVLSEFISQSSLGLQILTASSVDMALAIIDKESPNVVVSDVVMPKKTGMDLLKELARREKKIPVIIVSGFGDRNVMRQAWSLGAFDFLDKPINSKRLIENLSIALEMGAEGLTGKPVFESLLKIQLEYKLLKKVREKAALSEQTAEQWIADLVRKATA